jgi:hypothetical protein
MANITEHINYSKAVYEQHRRWRIVREPLLAKLDVAYMKALETNNKTEQREVIAQKNFLRNITDYDFSNYESIDEIISYWPTELLGSRPPEFDPVLAQ